MVIVIPTDSVNPTAQVFDGNRTHDSIMNWTVSNNTILSSFTQEDLDICGPWICGGVTEIINCRRCKFFFCRIGRVGKAALGLVSGAQRKRNENFKRCQEKLLRLNDPTVKQISSNPTTVLRRPQLQASMLRKCEALETLFKKYGVDNIEKLVLAINKPLLDSFGVSTVSELKDTLGKVNRKNIELSYLNKKVSFDDFKYYVYNNSKLGWKNIDCFAAIPNNQKISLSVDISPASNTDCKLVFKDRGFVIPAIIEVNSYQFKGVPRGERAMIVAIRYENNQPFLAMKEVTVEAKIFDVEFKAMTLEELKVALKALD
jgi:hypothetical protein